MNGKKGQLDILFVVVALLAFAIALIIALNIINEMRVEIEGALPGNDVVPTLFDNATNFYTSFNIGFIALFAFGIISAMATSFFVNTHPVFSFVAFILLIIFTYLSAILSNFYEEFTKINELAVEVALFPNITFFFANLPKFMVIAIIFTIIITWAKLRQGVVQI